MTGRPSHHLYYRDIFLGPNTKLNNNIALKKGGHTHDYIVNYLILLCNRKFGLYAILKQI